MDWTKLSIDPCDPDIQKRMQVFLQSIRSIEKIDYMEWLLGKVKGTTCLDIGAVEHDLSYTEKPSWKHKRLKDVCSNLTGVDILEEPAVELNKRGYDIRICDATSEEYLGSKYDFVVLGDVLEHVENPVNLLRFSIRHLKENGQVIAKTPNPYYVDNIRNFARSKSFVNFEHIAWYTPTMALEIARRAECRLSAYVVFPRKRPWPSIFPKSDIFTRDFVYIFSHA
ncbi:hypothetical protein MNBD_GAMMA21-2170 [hydrothermal vent metagenome]|uniref:Uncharacterized protein n=1 Tax=hydrothermal vent metagenome TaxID=652676 RepID=A0A3B1A7X0_9ZZZZ